MLHVSLLEEIKQKHLKSGKLYPRPVVPCVECNNTLVICWGSVMRPYYRHKSLSSYKCKGGKFTMESEIHKFVKEEIVKFLNDGGKLIFTYKCSMCGKVNDYICLLYTSPSPRDLSTSRMPSSA